MNPFKEYSAKDKITFERQSALAVKPYDKKETGPYTKTRIILMNGTEFEANWFLHQFNRHCLNNDVRRTLALVRRQEQQQQKRISSLKPANESILETTIGYEQLAVDLTAEMAEKEKNPFVKAQLDFALLEDFDHLYRYSDLIYMEEGKNPESLVGGYTEITPGRPTISEPRHPNDDVRRHINCWQDDLLTRLHAGIITAAEQQTMNFYMNVGSYYHSEEGRKLYSEIAMIEEQHVTGYGSLMDPASSWFESWVMHEYTECYLYYSCYRDETDERIKDIWYKHFEQELVHLKIASETMLKYEGRDASSMFVQSAEFPSLIRLKSNKGYIREALKTVRLTGDYENIIKVDDLPDSAEFFKYQRAVCPNAEKTPSHRVIEKHIKKYGEDYRYEDSAHPEKLLRDRKADNTKLGRVKGL